MYYIQHGKNVDINIFEKDFPNSFIKNNTTRTINI
jgi:hypothetical protein